MSVGKKLVLAALIIENYIVGPLNKTTFGFKSLPFVIKVKWSVRKSVPIGTWNWVFSYKFGIYFC